MENNDISINRELCQKCRYCIGVCPNVIFEWQNDSVTIREDRAELCFQCGQCMAVCSSQAMKIVNLEYDNDIISISDNTIYDNSFFELITKRRAIRNFKDKPVPKELLEKIVTAISLAPPSFPPLKTELTIVDDKTIIKKALPIMIEFYENLLKLMKSPIKRNLVKMSAGKETFNTMQNHLIPILIKRLPQLKDGTEDTITRSAPALILFHADKKADNFRTDINIAVTYGILAASSLGLGATVIDLIPPAVQRDKNLRQLFQIPDDNIVVASMILGYPKYKYLRTIKRNLKSVKWV